MSASQRHEGLHDLAIRATRERDHSAWGELLRRTLPEIWLRAIRILGDADPATVSRLVGDTLTAMAACVDELQVGSDDATTYEAFAAWWQKLMALAQDQGNYERAQHHAFAPRARFTDVPPPQDDSLTPLIRGAQRVTAADPRCDLMVHILPDVVAAARRSGPTSSAGKLVARTIAAILEQIQSFSLSEGGNDAQQRYDVERRFKEWWLAIMARL